MISRINFHVLLLDRASYLQHCKSSPYLHNSLEFTLCRTYIVSYDHHDKLVKLVCVYIVNVLYWILQDPMRCCNEQIFLCTQGICHAGHSEMLYCKHICVLFPQQNWCRSECIPTTKAMNGNKAHSLQTDLKINNLNLELAHWIPAG